MEIATLIVKLALAVAIIMKIKQSKTMEQMVRTIMVILAVLAIYVVM